MKDIIDVSRYQGNIDWDKLAGKIGGAMLKTGEHQQELRRHLHRPHV